jgi:hypothetical protein
MWRTVGTTARTSGAFTIISLSKPGRGTVRRTQRESATALERRRRNSAIFCAMEAALKALCRGFTKAELLRLAEKFETVKGVRVDRSARRQKDCLVCWFCENCPELLDPNPAQVVPPNAFVQTAIQNAKFLRDMQTEYFECEAPD